METRKAHDILIVTAVMVLVASTEAFADMVPADYRLMDCEPASFAELAAYDSVGRAAGSSVSRPWGNITGPNVLGTNWRLWFFDAGTVPPGWDSGTPFIDGLQPIGYYNTGGGIDYNFQDTLFPSDYGLYGYSPVTNTIDEGAVEDYPVTIYVE